uniref:Serpin domain-containing protein n=1 Tax=Ditylenchus dipsaci TaxID=166011 RepID=A0A915DLX7_9BILA
MQIEESQLTLSLELFRQLVDCENVSDLKNTVISPFSLSIVLAVLYEGSSGETAKELALLMTGSDKLDDCNLHYSREYFVCLMQSLKKCHSKNCQLLITNKVFKSIEKEVNENFANTIQKSYLFDEETVNFVDAEKAAKTINEFVNKATNCMLPAITAADQIDPTTCLLLLSVLYFKGSWGFGPFNIDCTQKATFHNFDGQKPQVDTMFKHISAPYYGDDQLQAVRLPYSSPNVSMILLLPRNKENFSQVVQNLDANFLQSIMNGKKTVEREVDVHLPKFKVDSKHDLTSVLKNLV